MNLPDIHHDFVIAKHNQGIKLVAPESRQASITGIMSVADCMKDPAHVYFTDRTQVIRQMNDACIHNLGVASRSDVIGHTIARISSCPQTNNSLESNNREVIQQNCMKLFDEFGAFRSGNMLHTLSIKMPWYDVNNSLIGIFGYSILIEKDNISKLPSVFAETMNRFTLTENQLLGVENPALTNIFSSRENEILRWVVRGRTMREIAEIIGLSRRTIEAYFENIKNKLGVKTRSQVVDLVVDYFI